MSYRKDDHQDHQVSVNVDDMIAGSALITCWTCEEAFVVEVLS